MTGNELINRIRQLNAESDEVGFLDKYGLFQEISGVERDDIDDDKVVIV